MSALLQIVQRSVRRYHLLPAGSRVVIGLSGGSDSVALILILQELSRHGGFEVGALAHLNHHIRPAAIDDEAFCRALASRLGLPLVVESVDVPDLAASRRLSLEDAARRARYDFLRRTAADAGAAVVAVGHTRDDQAETVLLKLARGAGLAGLGAIYPRRDEVVRPLIDVSRLDLRAFLTERGQTWVEDETNADLTNPRNRIRHRVLPELEAAYGGATRRTLARVAELAREDADCLDRQANARYSDLCVEAGTGSPPLRATVEVEVAGLHREPVAIRRRVLLRALRFLSSGREIGFDHVQSALDVAAGQTAKVDLPGVRVELRRGKLVLIQQDAVSK